MHRPYKVVLSEKSIPAQQRSKTRNSAQFMLVHGEISHGYTLGDIAAVGKEKNDKPETKAYRFV